jgi:hypothetical protein
MKKINSNLVSSAKVIKEDKFAEFTTLFRIPFKEHDPNNKLIKVDWRDILGSWQETCILALNMRMDACVSMLFRNRENVIWADEHEICFRKNNGMLHTFRHVSFRNMEDMVTALQHGEWSFIKDFPNGVAQLRKALYWIPEEDRKDHGCFSFGQLVSCLEELEMGARLNIR